MKGKREPAVSVQLPFDEAMRRVMSVKPPPEGWRKYEANLRKKKRKKKSSRK
jgi:hypothetical protein